MTTTAEPIPSGYGASEAPKWWRSEVPGGVVFGGRLLFFTILLAVAMFRGGHWITEPAGILLASLAAGAAVASAFLHEPHRRISNAIQLVVLAPWFVAALARGAHAGTARGVWALAGGAALFVLASLHLRAESAWTRWTCLLLGFFWCAIP